MAIVLLLSLLLVNATGYLAQPTSIAGYATTAFALVTPPSAVMTTTTGGKSRAANSGKICMKPEPASC